MTENLEMFLLGLYEKISEPIIWVDMQGMILSINPKTEEYFGYKKDELIGHHIEILVPNKFKRKHHIARKKYLENPIPRPMGGGIKLQAQHKNGHAMDVDISLCPITLSSGERAIATLIRDIRAYRNYEKKLIDLYNHDALTGLMTGAYLHTKLQDLTKQELNTENIFALCIIDVDNFKFINDTYGHDTGNKVLQQIAQIITKKTRKNDIVARLGGDEFLLLLMDFSNTNDIEQIVKKIHSCLSETVYTIEDRTLKISVSMGISIFPYDAKNASLLFKKADQAMYAVKHHKKNNFLFSNPLDLVRKKHPQIPTQYSGKLHRFVNLLSLPLLHSYLDHVLTENHQNSIHCLWIDTDHLQDINQVFGYHIGDQLLEVLAQRIKQLIEKQNALLARKHGDEFIILLINFTKKSATHIAKKIIKNISKPVQIENQQLYPSVSIGIASYPRDTQNKDELLQYADTALQIAKKSGKNTFEYYDTKKGLHEKYIQTLRSDIPRAIENHEFFLYYQAQYDLLNHQIIGAEALLRWQHPIFGLIKPEIFIPIIEQTPAIHQMTDWVLTEACQHAKRWQNFVKNFCISVNISANQLSTIFQRENYKLTNSVKNAIEKSGLSPEFLELEITESLILDLKSTKNNLKKLKALGIRIACDDFGINFSSFHRLKDLPLSTIKIHGDLMQDTSQESTGYTIIDAIQKISKKMKAKLIVEGISTQKQADILKELGCQFAQGYFYGKPLPAKTFEERLLAQHPF